MNQQAMEELLTQGRPGDIPPIFIPSYNRPVFATATRILSRFDREALERVHIVVRPEQVRDYKRANPKLNILDIPATYPIGGLASTRQFIFEYAVRHLMPIIIDMDDDITQLRYLYTAKNGQGKPCSRACNKTEDWTRLPEAVLCLGGYIAKDIFKSDPKVMLGNIHRRRMSMHPELAITRYQVNSGPTPRQVTFVNVKGLYRAKINRSMAFDKHGDDIGFCAEILAAGGKLFNIPCLIYDYISEKCDSVCRTPETAKALHKLEYDALQLRPIRNYLRTSFRDEDGDYMWGDIDWRAYHKLNGTKPLKVLWDNAECGDV